MAAPGHQPQYQHPMVRVQFQAQQSPHAGPATPTMMQFGSPTKETPNPHAQVNTASLCKIGQETVQDIVQKTQEIFQILKQTQLPNGTTTSGQAYQEKKSKLDESMKSLEVLFKKLRLVYDTVNQDTALFNTTQFENLIPMIENGEVTGEKPKVTDALKYANEEHRDIKEQVQARNREIKQVIDQLRTIVWEINTMMAMRKA